MYDKLLESPRKYDLSFPDKLCCWEPGSLFCAMFDGTGWLCSWYCEFSLLWGVITAILSCMVSCWSTGLCACCLLETRCAVLLLAYLQNRESKFPIVSQQFYVLPTFGVYQLTGNIARATMPTRLPISGVTLYPSCVTRFASHASYTCPNRCSTWWSDAALATLWVGHWD